LTLSDPDEVSKEYIEPIKNSEAKNAKINNTDVKSTLDIIANLSD
jgi:hypothetical protein